ncbi:MAG: SapC family protein [Paraglaciecola sp.]|uniref:SapC family protein n=1 Tax=Pseudomonadati TaxID=3379134 RepID=UPI00273EAB32|nr:SapC family protein [Paraglaciecola sp.]MDP5029742.1 SapC family protein [Paraglaciecola sp.]MDP5131640.1 SapC family protein [Paraglaciecola sp.]
MNYIPLDKEKHKDLRVNLNHEFAHVKDAHIAAASLKEYAQLASCMPIVFVKDPKSEITHSVVMLGTEQNVNLYMQSGKWSAHSVPLNIQRYPFDVRPDGDKLGVYIDADSPLVGKEEGELLFTETGEASPYLDNRQKLLSELANSEMATQRFIKKLIELKLLDPIVLRVQYASGQQRNINGMQSISEKRLHELSDEQTLELHKAGFLGAIYAILLSLGQLNRLVQMSTEGETPIQSLQLRIEEPAKEEATA